MEKSSAGAACGAGRMGTRAEDEDEDSEFASAFGARVRDRFNARRTVGVELRTTLWAAAGSSANVKVRRAIPGRCGTVSQRIVGLNGLGNVRDGSPTSFLRWG
jgi:hypothetical protein